nr:reverse transcriptase domain-containing protein [Tanacetum cinerariifolium]
MRKKRTTTPMIDASIKQLIAQGIANALAEYEVNRSSGNSDDIHDSGSCGSRHVPTTRECMYSDFLKCQPLNFKGTEGVVRLTQWLEKMESVFYISNCSVACQSSSVMASKLKTMQEAIEIANDLMDQKVRAYDERQVENKRKLDNNNQAQQQPPNKQNVARVYSVRPSEKKEYAGTLLLCNKCKFHHNGPCTIKCANCNRVGHLTRDCSSRAATNNQMTLTYFECVNQGHSRSDFPELKNWNHGNRARGTEAHGMVYALGRGKTDQVLDNIEDYINA